MAKSRIKGITIELDGNTTGLQESLKDVNKKSIDLQSELRDVEKLLKFDPGNVEALAQKQKILTQQIENTSDKLQALKNAQEQVEQQFQSGDIGEEQYRAFRREIEYTEKSLNNMKKKLSDIDSDSSIDTVKADMQELDEATDEASSSISDLGGELTNLLAGAAAVGTIGEAIETALDTSSLNTKINISMEVPEESKQSVKDAINTVTSYGLDAEEVLEGVRRQWALNADATDENNKKVIESAGAIAAAYSDIDFIELIQESNELSKTLEISDEEALGLVNTLLKTGFPPDQLDIITEYGSQLHNAGYNAQEIQAIMASGVETGSWNIDILLDGLKEGRIVLAEFGAEVDDETANLFKKVGVSKTQLQDWGKAVAEGGASGKAAMEEVAKTLDGVKDKTLQNQIGTTVFGTLWEENGTNITDTILGMNDNLTTAKENQDGLNQTVSELNSDPAVVFQQAISELKIALEPLLLGISEIVANIAEWVQANPTLAAAIVAIVSVITILVGICMALSPILLTISTLATGLGIGFTAMAAPILGVIAVITALVAAGVALYKNWDTIKVKAIELKNQVVNKFNELKTQAIAKFNELKNKVSTTVNNIKNGLVNGFNNMKSRAIEIVNNIKDSIINKFKSVNLLQIGKDIINGLINGIQSKVSGVINACKDIGNAITGKVKSILGIHSPSRVMMELGEFTGEGLVKGLGNQLKSVSSKSAEMANAVTDGFGTENITTSINNKSNLDYKKLSNVLIDSFEKAIKSTGMNNMNISLDKNKVGKVLSSVNDKISGEAISLRERGVNY